MSLLCINLSVNLGFVWVFNWVLNECVKWGGIQRNNKAVIALRDIGV